uniref:Uncharacterized protein n=1 Tax=Arundo donax TaxID=35708 RepID=A0A0A8XSM7_ARUDO
MMFRRSAHAGSCQLPHVCYLAWLYEHSQQAIAIIDHKSTHGRVAFSWRLNQLNPRPFLSYLFAYLKSAGSATPPFVICQIASSGAPTLDVKVCWLGIV